MILPFLKQYIPLVLSAIFLSAVIPINNTMATHLASGSISALNLGMKVVVFLTGLIGAGLTSVMIPYFSSFVTRDLFPMAKIELSFFLFIANIIAIISAIVLFSFSRPIVRYIFHGGAISAADIIVLSNIMKFGIIQLPFFSCGTLITKFFTAFQRTRVVMIATFIGLLFNILFNFILIPMMGILGVALAMTLGTFLTMIILLSITSFYRLLKGLDLLFTLFSWILFLTILLCFYNESQVGTVVSMVGLFSLVVCQFLLFNGSYWNCKAQKIPQ